LQEVKIPGKKMFGFSSETRLFVSGVEEGSTAADLLAPGDEITQVGVHTKYMILGYIYAIVVCML
jgi:hypothetical protein